MKNLVIYILFIVCGCLALGWAGANEKYKTALKHKAEIIIQSEIMSIRELQRALVDAGYDIQVDGKIGRQTMAAWEKHCCNQYAIRAFKEAEK